MPRDRFDYLELEDAAAALERSDTAAWEPAAAEAAAVTPFRGDLRLRVRRLVGEAGTAIGQFNNPGGLCADRHGTLFVADSYNHRIQKVTPDGGAISLGHRGTRAGEFMNPQGVAVDTAGAAYIVEQGNHRVQKFLPDGTCVRVLGGFGTDIGQFRFPAGIAVDLFHNIYVADTGNARLQVFTAEGRFAYAITAGFSSPQGLAVADDGDLFVADTGNHRVVQLTPAGKVRHIVGRPGRHLGEWDEPQDLALGRRGWLFVVEVGNHRVQCLHDGRPIAAVHAFDHGLALRGPMGVALRADGVLVVADTLHHRLVELELDTGLGV